MSSLSMFTLSKTESPALALNKLRKPNFFELSLKIQGLESISTNTFKGLLSKTSWVFEDWLEHSLKLSSLISYLLFIFFIFINKIFFFEKIYFIFFFIIIIKYIYILYLELEILFLFLFL